MAKGDANAAQDTINKQGNTAQTGLTNLQNVNTGLTNQFQSLYGPAASGNVADYGAGQAAYQQFLKGMPNAASLYSTFLGPKYAQPSPNATGATAAGPASATDPTISVSDNPVDQLFAKYGLKDTGQGSGTTDASYWKDKIASAPDDATKQYYLGRLESDFQGSGPDPKSGASGGSGTRSDSAIGSAIGGYQNFANTGGFSPEDIANIRARSIAPIRSMQDRNDQEIQRQAALRGTGYSPNTAAAIAKVNRDSAYAAGDTATNAEAQIAQMIQQGKLYGLGGLSSTGLTDQSNNTANRNLDLSAITSSGNQQLGALGGQTSLYGTTPGLTSTFGNQLLNSTGQGIQGGGLENQLASLLIQGQLGKAGVPGNFQSALGNIGSIGSLIGGTMGLFA